MAKAITLFFLVILSCFLSLNYVSGKSNGLTIKLIHRDSPESPFYDPSLTYSQRMERLVKQSKARMQYLSNLRHRNPSDLRSKVDADNQFTFLAQIGVGSFSNPREQFKSYYLHMDTGSDIAWLECMDCRLPGNHCFRQTGEPFPDNSSSSYEKFLCNPPRGHPLHPLCDPKDCIGQFCGYKIDYLDESGSKGFLAKERFTFETSTRQKEKVPNLVFGCGIDNQRFAYQNGSNVAGILGLGWGPKSFVNQLGRKSLGRFSYCLQRMNQRNLSTFLHFGEDIPTTRAIYNTSLIEYKGDSSYFVNLIGISVEGTRLDLSKSDFARKNGKGGCTIDSGTGFSLIPTFAFVKLKQRLKAYFSNIPGFVTVRSKFYDLCFKRKTGKKGFRNFPTIIFHFEKADLHVEPEGLFVLKEIQDGSQRFCLSMFDYKGDDRVTIIGAYQQTNYRFIYYTKSRKLRFGPENCSKNA